MEPASFGVPVAAVVLLCLHLLSLHAVAFGPVESNVQRPDGLCNSLVLPLKLYNCDEFVVQTDDLFLLGLQRVSRRGNYSDLKGPVFLLHGVLLGGDVWVLNPPNEAFAFVLADAGYDVWIGNTRTTRFSYGHVFYTKVDKGFWEWSVDEMAEYDLPAMLGVMQMETNKKILYVGYSQGSQQALVAFSQGQLVELVEKVVLLGPVAYVNYVSAPVSTLSATFYIDRLYEVLHVYEFNTQYRMKQIVDTICKPSAKRCYETYLSLFTGNNCCLNLTRRPIYDEYETQPTSTKNLQHLAQQYRQKTFAKFDYGFWGNIMRYHWPSPPAYDLTKVPTNNLCFFYGGRDTLADPKDVALLISKLSGQIPVTFISQYAHLDFILATNAKDFVYNQVMQFLES